MIYIFCALIGIMVGSVVRGILEHYNTAKDNRYTVTILNNPDVGDWCDLTGKYSFHNVTIVPTSDKGLFVVPQGEEALGSLKELPNVTKVKTEDLLEKMGALPKKEEKE